MLLALLMTSGLRAEIIYLKNGKSINGKVIGQNADSISFMTEDGKITILKKDIQRVFYASSMGQEERVRVDNLLERMGGLDRSIAPTLEKRREDEKQKQDEISRRAEEEALFFRDELEEIKKRKKRVAARKSAFLPGWGQFYKGDSIRGWGIVGTGLFSVVGIYYGSQMYGKYKTGYDANNQIFLLGLAKFHSIPLAVWHYQNATNERAKMETNISSAVTFGAILAGLYFLNVGDAYLFDPDLDEEMADRRPASNTGRFAVGYEEGKRGGDSLQSESAYSISYSIPF
jgi:hypothetical protein